MEGPQTFCLLDKIGSNNVVVQSMEIGRLESRWGERGHVISKVIASNI